MPRPVQQSHLTCLMSPCSCSHHRHLELLILGGVRFHDSRLVTKEQRDAGLPPQGTEALANLPFPTAPFTAPCTLRPAPEQNCCASPLGLHRYLIAPALPHPSLARQLWGLRI